MNNYKRITLMLFTILSMIILISAPQTAAYGVSQGLDVCIKTIIPALFPFIVIATYCSKLLIGTHFRMLKLLLSPCRIPPSAENIFLISILSGYPVGAKLVRNAYDNGSLSKKDAQRMLMFCNNAGPSFVFGILVSMFTKKWIVWIIWAVHIISAYLVGITTATPPTETGLRLNPGQDTPSITQTVFDSLKTISNICGWIILFRVLFVFMDEWFMDALPNTTRVLISGLLELSNGCTQLLLIENEKIRIIIAVLMVTFGGLCVTLQTEAVTSNLSPLFYLAGKAYQCLFALLLSFPVLIFKDLSQILVSIALCALSLYLLIRITHKSKIVVAFRK